MSAPYWEWRVTWDGGRAEAFLSAECARSWAEELLADPDAADPDTVRLDKLRVVPVSRAVETPEGWVMGPL